jgi:hypothetical protein
MLVSRVTGVIQCGGERTNDQAEDTAELARRPPRGEGDRLDRHVAVADVDLRTPPRREKLKR